MRKSILFALIFVVLISIGYSQAPWHSNIHLSRFNITVYAYLPPTYPDWVRDSLGFFPNYIVTAVPLIIDTKSLGITNCSEIYIYSSNDNGFVYFFVDTRQFVDDDYSCGSSTTQFYVRMILKYVGYDPGLNVSVYKNVVYFYFNPIIQPNKNYNDFRFVFTDGIEITRFRTFQSGFYEPSDVEKKAYFNFSFVYANIPTPYTSISDHEGLYFQFILIPKVPGTVYFRLNNLDDHIKICEQGYVHPTYLNCKVTILETHLGWWGWPSPPYETTYTINRFTPIMIYFDNDGGPGNFELYIKHETWDTYRKIDINDESVANTFYVLTLGEGVISPSGTIVGRGVPVLYYNTIQGSTEINFDMIAQRYRYVLEITIDTTNINDYPSLFASGLSNGQINFILNTKSLISSGYLDPQCSNILFLFDNETVQYFWFDKEYCGLDNTLFFVRIPNIPSGQIKKLYMYMSPTTVSYNKYYDPYSTFIFRDFNSLSDVYALFKTDSAYCNNIRYFDVQNGQLIIYGSPCGTRLYLVPLWHLGNFVAKITRIYSVEPYNQTETVSRVDGNLFLNYEYYNNRFIVDDFWGFMGDFFNDPYSNVTIILNSKFKFIPYYRNLYKPFYDFLNKSYYKSIPGYSRVAISYYPDSLGSDVSLGPLYNFTILIDYFAWFTPMHEDARISVGVAEYIPPPVITYTIYLNATDQYNNLVSTTIYINGTRYSTESSANLLNATYIISADIPSNYAFVRWSSKYGNITFANPYNLTTTIRVWGNDVLILILSYSPTPPPAKYRVYCYIYTTGGQDVDDSFLIIGDRGCPHEAYLDLDAGTYSLDIYFDTSKYSFNRYSYSGNIYIPNIFSKTTSVTVNGNGTITAYLSTIILPAPPPTQNITMPSIPFVNYFGIDKLLAFILILVIGGILAIENIIIGSSFAITGLILTFLGIDAVAVIIILFSLIVSYAIIKFLKR